MTTENQEYKDCNDALKKLTCFMFLIIRDHVPTGAISKILSDIGDIKDVEVVYDNKYLKTLSEDYAKRLLE